MIASCRGKPFIDIHDEIQLLEESLLRHQVGCRENDVPYIGILTARRSWTGIIKQAPDNPVDPGAVFRDAPGIILDGRAIRLFTRGELGIPHDRCERGADFMGHAGCEQADGSHFFGADRLFPGLGEIAVGLLRAAICSATWRSLFRSADAISLNAAASRASSALPDTFSLCPYCPPVIFSVAVNSRFIGLTTIRDRTKEPRPSSKIKSSTK